jgi:hypothetical protein
MKVVSLGDKTRDEGNPNGEERRSKVDENLVGLRGGDKRMG